LRLEEKLYDHGTVERVCVPSAPPRFQQPVLYRPTVDPLCKVQVYVIKEFDCVSNGTLIFFGMLVTADREKSGRAERRKMYVSLGSVLYIPAARCLVNCGALKPFPSPLFYS